jgi:hypothetical protein
MSWMDWIAFKHVLFVHLPIAAALMAPLPLIAAQRPGRGIKPWWIACRYVVWAGVLGSVTAVITGLRAAQTAHLLPSGEFIARGSFHDPGTFQMHQWLAGSSLVLGLLTLKTLHRRREDHQGIGVLALFLGLLWSGATLVAAFYGNQLSHPVVIKTPVSHSVTAAPPKVDPEASAPLRAMDYMSLIPMHVEPVKSIPHGNRWIRVWANAKAADAYRDGKPLPEGSLVVMNTFEDRWGKPGYEQGPLYALEVKPEGKSSLTFYWPRVPEARRNETHGQDRAYWRDDDPNLKSCMACHAQGMAPMKDRSKWVVPKPKPKTDEAGTK